MSIPPRPAPIAVALDAPDLETAARWASLVTPHVSTVKIGLELYLRYGPDAVASVRGASGVRGIPRPEAARHPRDGRQAPRGWSARLRPALLTVHAAGGQAMIRAAVEAAPETQIAAVTVLTSLSGADLAQAGVAGTVPDVARRLAALAVGAGARALVCSPQEVAAVRAEVGPEHHADHAGCPAGRFGEPGSGPGSDAGGSAERGRGSARDRAPDHQRRPILARPRPPWPPRCAAAPRSTGPRDSQLA